MSARDRGSGARLGRLHEQCENRQAETESREGAAVLPFWIFLAFMLGIIVGSLVARGVGALPDAAELEQQDQARFAKIERSQ
jgi:hypothetical protein